MFRSVVDVCPWNYVAIVSVVFKIRFNLLLLRVRFQRDVFSVGGGGEGGRMCEDDCRCRVCTTHRTEDPS